MPHANHRIDVLLVSSDPEHEITEADWGTIRGAWSAEGWFDDGPSVPSTTALVIGGCERVRLDKPGRTVLYANQQGGFYVRCPNGAQNIAGPFGVALSAWKKDGPRSVDCPACGSVHDLTECVLSPPAAFGRWAIVFANAEGAACTASARSAVEAVVGPVREVVRRLL